MVSSLQAKWVKFLQFMDALPGYEDVSAVTYHDHKFRVRAEHIEWILRERSADHDLMIRETPRVKLSIADEIGDAMNQERYVRHMPETITFLDGLDANLRTKTIRIVNTGLIHYRDLMACRAFTQQVYDMCIKLQQPECQIIWPALAQTSPIRIQQVPWSLLEPLWREPMDDDLDAVVK